MRIYPSVLESDPSEFVHTLSSFSPLFPYIQIDIADGILVTGQTLSLTDIVDIARDGNLPTGSKYELHLMVKDWSSQLSQIRALAELITIPRLLIHAPVFNSEISIPGVEIGIVFSPEDKVASYANLVKNCPAVQIMTVAPGAQGRPFMPELLNKIDQVRQLHYEAEIILDGGINDSTLPLILSRENKPDSVCPGSFLRLGDPRSQLAKLERILASFN